MLKAARERARRRPLVAFFLLAFLWSWSYDAGVYLFVGSSPGILVRGVVRAWGPLVAAGIVAWAIGGDLRDWAGQVTRWRVNARWYVLAFVIPFIWLDGLAVSGVHLLMGGEVEVLPERPAIYLLNFVAVFFLAGGLEEFGWRGFAQPRLQEHVSALTAAIGIGIAWALWHLPLYFLFDLSAYDPSGFWTTVLFMSVLQSVVLAWLYNSTGGSILFPMIAHSAGNLPGFVVPAGPTGILVEYTVEVFGMVLIVGIVAVYGSQYLASSRPVSPASGDTGASSD